MGKPSLDKDLKKVGHLEKATGSLAQSLAAPGLLAIFMFGSIAAANLALGENAAGTATCSPAIRMPSFSYPHR